MPHSRFGTRTSPPDNAGHPKNDAQPEYAFFGDAEFTKPPLKA